MKSYKGSFRPRFPQKYQGNPGNITYRSLWELNCMKYFDLNTSILSWSSEEIVVPYISPKDGDWHRYFPDFLIKVKNRKGDVETILIEVKPYKQTHPPELKSRRTKKYINEVMTWGVNDAKWKAARAFCEKKNWQFMIVTEKELFKKK